MSGWGRNLTDQYFVCRVCNKNMTDEKGACFGNGYLCLTCGYYRLDRQDGRQPSLPSNIDNDIKDPKGDKPV